MGSSLNCSGRCCRSTRNKQQGKVRFIGFTGHKDPAIHLRMLAHDFPFDTVQMPLNCFDATFRGFEAQVLPEVNRRGIATNLLRSGVAATAPRNVSIYC
jgi:predicted aldo/keto reductase-like oxidoreductase